MESANLTPVRTPTKPAYVTLRPRTMLPAPPLDLTNSRITIISRSLSMPQSSVRKCIMRVDASFLLPSLGLTRTPPDVQPMKESRSTLKATRRYISMPATSAIPRSSSFSSWVYTRLSIAREIAWMGLMGAQGTTHCITSSKREVRSRI